MAKFVHVHDHIASLWILNCSMYIWLSFSSISSRTYLVTCLIRTIYIGTSKFVWLNMVHDIAWPLQERKITAIDNMTNKEGYLDKEGEMWQLRVRICLRFQMHVRLGLEKGSLQNSQKVGSLLQPPDLNAYSIRFPCQVTRERGKSMPGRTLQYSNTIVLLRKLFVMEVRAIFLSQGF